MTSTTTARGVLATHVAWRPVWLCHACITEQFPCRTLVEELKQQPQAQASVFLGAHLELALQELRDVPESVLRERFLGPLGL